MNKDVRIVDLAKIYGYNTLDNGTHQYLSTKVRELPISLDRFLQERRSIAPRNMEHSGKMCHLA